MFFSLKTPTFIHSLIHMNNCTYIFNIKESTYIYIGNLYILELKNKRFMHLSFQKYFCGGGADDDDDDLTNYIVIFID